LSKSFNGKNVCKWVPVTEEKCIPGVQFGPDNCPWVETCSDVSNEAECMGKNTGATSCCEWQYPESKKASCQAIPNRTCDDGVDCSSFTTCKGADAPKMTVDCCEWDDNVIGAKNGRCVKKAKYKDKDSIPCTSSTYDACLSGNNADHCEWQLLKDESRGIACTVKNNDLAKNLAKSKEGNCKNCEKMPTSTLCAGLKQEVDCCRKLTSEEPFRHFRRR
jgi:hypothetical protein